MWGSRKSARSHSSIGRIHRRRIVSGAGGMSGRSGFARMAMTRRMTCDRLVVVGCSGIGLRRFRRRGRTSFRWHDGLRKSGSGNE